MLLTDNLIENAGWTVSVLFFYSLNKITRYKILIKKWKCTLWKINKITINKLRTFEIALYVWLLKFNIYKHFSLRFFLHLNKYFYLLKFIHYLYKKVNSVYITTIFLRVLIKREKTIENFKRTLQEMFVYIFIT